MGDRDAARKLQEAEDARAALERQLAELGASEV